MCGVAIKSVVGIGIQVETNKVIVVGRVAGKNIIVAEEKKSGIGVVVSSVVGKNVVVGARCEVKTTLRVAVC